MAASGLSGPAETGPFFQDRTPGFSLDSSFLLSLHTAHFVAGITFTQIRVLTSRPSLWSIWDLQYLLLYDEIQFSQEMKKNFSFSRACIKKEFLLKVASQTQLNWELLGTTPRAREPQLEGHRLRVLGLWTKRLASLCFSFLFVSEDRKSACPVGLLRGPSESEVRTVAAPGPLLVIWKPWMSHFPCLG